MSIAIFRCYCVSPMKVLDFVQFVGPKCTELSLSQNEEGCGVTDSLDAKV